MKTAGQQGRVVRFVAVGWLAAAAWAASRPAEAQLAPLVEPPSFAPAISQGPIGSSIAQGQGLAGLTRVLDEVLPDTAAPKVLSEPTSVIEALIADLGADSYRVREAATRRLTELGDGAKPMLLRAAEDSNAEIAWRAARVIRTWDAEKLAERPQCLQEFSAYCLLMSDGPRLKELARRTKLALDHGLWGETRAEILRQCITALLRSREREYVDLLAPYLKHKDLEVALLVTEAAGQDLISGDEASPLFLLAIESGREEVAVAAISYASHRPTAEKSDEVKQALLAIFKGNNENLKFQAAHPLMQVYRDAAAYDFVLAQLGKSDIVRRHEAISWLHAPDHLKSTPDKKLLDAISPLLADDEEGMKMTAAYALSTYTGEEVVRRLLPLLNDTAEDVAEQVANRLMEQPDQKMLRRVLSEAKPSKLAQPRIKTLLEQIDRLEAEPTGVSVAPSNLVPSPCTPNPPARALR